MEVADERGTDAGIEHALLDLGYGGRRFRQVDGHADHLRAGLGELDALARGAGGIGRVSHRH